MVRIHSPGARIASRYEVASRPLMGGMGIVYVCLDLEEDRPVALKTFRPEYLPDRATRDRFLREGTHWVDLGAHPHVVRCYNVLYIDPEVYLVLELVAKEQGREDASLRSWLTPGQPLPVEQALLFALQIARGMKHAVDTIPGFVHRDLKPENVLVGADKLGDINRLRVTDFGLSAALEELGIKASKVLGEAQVRTTSEGSAGLGRTQLTRGIVGTPLYMAPEQWRGEKLALSGVEGVSAATDVYALGCILYEMVAGQRIVAGSSLAALERAHCRGEVQPLSPEVPGVVRDAVARCTALKSCERYTNWEEGEAALAIAYQRVSGRAAPPLESAGALSRKEWIAAGWSYNAMGGSYLDLGKAEVAVGYLRRAAEAGKIDGDRELEGGALSNLGLAYAVLGDVRQAVGYHEQSLAILREIGDRQGEGATLGNLGLAYTQLGDARRAICYYEQHLAIAREIGDLHGESNALTNLGGAYFQLGDARRAISYHEQSLMITREIRDRRGEGNALGNLGTAYYQLGDARRAIGYHDQHLAIAREIGDRSGEGKALGNLGTAYLQLGDTHRAIGYFEQRLAIAREIGERQGEGNALGNLGIAYAHLGDTRGAIGYFEQQLAITREIDDRRGESNALGNLGNAYLRLGDASRAIEYHEQALTISREIGDRLTAAALTASLAMSLAQTGRVTEAIPLAQQAVSEFRQAGYPQHAQRAEQLLAHLQAAQH
jgi:tetratricopeptide (TPR) repeat protein